VKELQRREVVNKGEGRPWLLGFSELVEVTGIPESCLKNWSFGRPLRIKPYKLIGRNRLYTEAEVWQFVVAHALATFGFGTCENLQSALDQITTEQVAKFSRDVDALAISRSGKDYAVEFIAKNQIPAVPDVGSFVLPVGPLREKLLKNIRALNRSKQ
jgi:hypothetical protein